MERFRFPAMPGFAPPRPSAFPALVLTALIAIVAITPPSHAGESDESMLNITKTTVYGALLGGLLGLTTSLVVDSDSRDDTIRWGVALGAIAGFAYGVIVARDDGFSDARDPLLPAPALAGDDAPEPAPLEGVGIGLASKSRAPMGEAVDLSDSAAPRWR